jgi:anti-sigma factor RsiW
VHTCREIEKLLDTYTDGELDQPRRLKVEAHLQGCALCSRLAHYKVDEARLIRSGDPVPALSAGFTAQIMSNLNGSNSRAEGKGFFSLRKLLTRPWLAPALAGLMLLVTVSWAASSHLLPASPGQVAFQGSSRAPYGRGRAAQMPKTPVSSGNNNLRRQDALKPGLPKGSEREDTRGSDGNNALNISEGPANIPAPAGSPAIVPSPQDNWETAAGASSSGRAASQAMAPPTISPAPEARSYEELEQQGYAVFEPGYLPPGYSLATASPQPPDPGIDSTGSAPEATPYPGQDSLLLTYRNTQAGGWITLEIQPLNSPAPQPVTTSANATGNPTAGTMASANATGSQPPSADQIVRQAQKNGASFLLTVTGSLPDEELKRVAASVH